METTFKVSVLDEESLHWFVDIACVNMLVRELNRPSLVNIEHLYKLARHTMNDATSFIVKRHGELVGALGSILVPNTFNPEYKTLAELFWYVLPEYRESRAGVLLLKAFEEKAEEVADEATLSLLSTSRVNISTLEKRGFMLGELAFRKEIRRM